MNLFETLKKRLFYKSVNNGAVPLGVLANRSRGLFSTDTLNNPDKILQNNNITLESLSSFVLDPHVFSCIQSRKAGVLSLRWMISQQDENNPVAQFINNVFTKLNVRQIITDILDAPLYGFKPLEIYWAVTSDNLVYPKAVIGKPSWWFAFDEIGNLLFIDPNLSEKMLVPKNKFLVANHQASFINPYGEPILSKCYYPVIYKKGALLLWSKFVEKYGMPLLQGIIKTQNPDQANQLLDALETLVQDGAIVLPETMDVKELSKPSNASGEIYNQLINHCNAEISKAILSQTLTTEQTSTGSYAMSNTHFQVRKEVIDNDKLLAENVINQLIQIVVDYNFPNVEDYPIFSMFSDIDIDLNLAQRDATLANTNQIKFTKKYFVTNYGFKEDEIDVVTQNTQAPQPLTFNEFATKEDDPSTLLNDALKPIINQVVNMFSESNSYEDIQNYILNALPDFSTKQLEDVIALAIAIATAKGVVGL